MTNTQQHPKKPSKKQLALLRSLATERGQSFAYPQTSAEADLAIKRLKKGKRLSRSDRAREDRAVREAMSAGRGDASRVRPEELSGYGSEARWLHHTRD
jgi:hypothetical protein